MVVATTLQPRLSFASCSQKRLTEELAAVMSLDVPAPEREIFEATLEAVRAKDAVTDAEKRNACSGFMAAGG